MFIFNEHPLSPDAAFTDPATGIQYPANWLLLSSPDERAAIGITEEPEPAPYDQRFYWGPELLKDHPQLVEQWVAQTRTTANTLLAPTDWQVIREADNGTVMSAETKAERQRIRTASNGRVNALTATTTTEDLAAYICSPAYSDWSPIVINDDEDNMEEVLTFSGGSTTSAF